MEDKTEQIDFYVKEEEGGLSSLYFIMGIEINGIEWTVVFTANQENLKRPDGSITLGVTDLNCRTIFLWVGLRGHMLRKVLIHELSHAHVHSYGFELPLEEEEFLCGFIDTYSSDILALAESVLSGNLKKFEEI